jgi:hypothetical protein
LQLAIGDSVARSKLRVLSTSNGSPAVYHPRGKVISVEESVYDVCHRFGARRDDCIAFVLSHELAHASLGHRASRFAAPDRPGELHRNTEMEADADYHAGFYAHLAGYDALGLGASVIDAMYECYALDDNLMGYLSRDERRQLVDGAFERAEQHVAVFDAATWLILGRSPHEARLLLDWLSLEFASPEVENNWAVAALAELRSRSKEKLRIPEVLDLRSRLVSVHVGRPNPRLFDEGGDVGGDLGGVVEREVDAALRGEVIRRLRTVIARAPDYAPARVNLVVALLLDDKLEDAEFELKKARDVVLASQARTIEPDLHLIDGLIRARRGDLEGAYDALRAARRTRPAEFEQNVRELVPANVLASERVREALDRARPNPTRDREELVELGSWVVRDAAVDALAYARAHPPPLLEARKRARTAIARSATAAKFAHLFGGTKGGGSILGGGGGGKLTGTLTNLIGTAGESSGAPETIAGRKPRDASLFQQAEVEILVPVIDARGSHLLRVTMCPQKVGSPHWERRSPTRDRRCSASRSV